MADEREPAAPEAQESRAEEQKHRRHHRGKEHDAPSAQLEARVAELEKAVADKDEAIAACTQDARDYLEGWQRERANFENFRKRTARELDDAGIVAKVDLIRQILPAVDNMERVLGDTSSDAETVRKGVQMIESQLLGVLERQGLKEVPSTGEPFDPNVHEAIEGVEGTEHAPDTIIQDLQKGYTFGERLVRPARVRVAR